MKKLFKTDRFRNSDINSFTYLSDIVNETKKNNESDKSAVHKSMKPLWIPSKSSFIKLGIIFLILTVIVKVGSPYTTKVLQYMFKLDENSSVIRNINLIPTISNDSGIFQNLIAINTGIGAVLVGLAFFVAQSLMDRDDPDKARVLLYKSKFFPLLASEVLVFFLLMIGEINYSIIIIIMVLGIFTIFSLGETIRILIRTNDLENAKSTVFFDILKDNFIKILNYEILRRLSNNTFLELTNKFSKEYKIRIMNNHYYFINNDNYITLRVHKKGHYSDVNLMRFEEMINFIANSTFNDSGINTNYKAKEISTQNITKSTKEPLVILHSKLYTEVKSDDPLLSIKRDLVKDHPEIIKSINEKLPAIFIIEDSINMQEDARFEISNLKERCMICIKDENTIELEKVLSVYDNLLIEFYNFTQPYGLSSRDQVEKERHAIFSERIQPLDWISRDIWEIFEKGMKSNDKNVIKQVAYLPVTLSKSAIRFNNHLIFQNYIHYVRYLYVFGYKRRFESDISTFMIDRSWRYITELIDYYLIPNYEQSKELSWGEFKDFAQYIIKVFQELIKNSYDNKDYDNYTIFIEKMYAAFDSIKYTNRKENIFLVNLKQQSLFGLGSWILFNVMENNESIEKKYLSFLIPYLPNNIVELTTLFTEVNSEEVKSKWDWLNWEFNNQKEKEPFWSTTSSNIEKFYSFLIVERAQGYSNEALLHINLPITYDFAHLIEDGGRLISSLEKIEDNIDDWEGLLSKEGMDKIDTLKSLLYKTKESYIEKEKDLIRETKISPDKVDLFKENFKKNISESYGIKDIYKKYSNWQLLEMKNNSGINEKNLGIRTFFDKAAFFEDKILPYIFYGGFDNAFDFGKIIERGENSFVVNKLKEQLPELKLDQNNNFSQEIKIKDNFIIISVNNASFYQFEYKIHSENYIPYWREEFLSLNIKDKNNLVGVYKSGDINLPVYNIYTQGEETILILLNANYMGKINQYIPDDTVEANQIEEFFINIKEIIKDSEEEISTLENPPNWLKDTGDRTKQWNYLQEKVIIEIAEKIDFSGGDETEGGIIHVKSNE